MLYYKKKKENSKGEKQMLFAVIINERGNGNDNGNDGEPSRTGLL